MMSKNQKRKKIALAMQAGGASGAFTWGVIDALLEDGRFDITGVSGASAGSINSILLAQGLAEGGNEGARKKLEEGWLGLIDLGDLKKQFNNEAKNLTKLQNFMPKKSWLSYFNPMANLRRALAVPAQLGKKYQKIAGAAFVDRFERMVDFDLLRSDKTIPIFVSATDMHASQPKVFTKKDLSAAAVAASCSVPGVLPAIEIDERTYHDGAFSLNPAIEPLVDHCDGTDVLVVQTIPLVHEAQPDEDFSKFSRITQIMMSSVLLNDIRHNRKKNDLIDKMEQEQPGFAKKMGMKKTYTHMINDMAELPDHHLLNMANFKQKYLLEIKEIGREAGQKWITENYDKIGKQSTYEADKDTSQRHSHIAEPSRKKTAAPKR